MPGKSPRSRSFAVVAALCLSTLAHADWTPDWISTIPAGSALSAGLRGLAVAPDGTSFVTGINGPSFNTNMLTVAFGSGGTQQWQDTFNGPGDWHDQARAIALAPGGSVWVVGNTPGPNN
ncbi:MAG: hypothetical protein ACYTF9_11455, partial [Planctomycetota bacterium]